MKEKHYRGKYTHVSASELRDKLGVNMADVALLQLIYRLHDPKRGCWALNHHLAKEVGFQDPKSVPRKLKKFAEMGLIKITIGPDNRSRRIDLLFVVEPSGSIQKQEREKAQPGWPIPTLSGGIGHPYINKDITKVISPPASSTQEKGFGLFGNGKEKDQTSHRIAEYLKAVILANSSRNPRINVTNWAHEISLLQREGITEEAIEQAIGWLEDHIKDPYTPVIRCAKSLRSKWDSLQAAMEREALKKPKPKKSRELSERATKLLATLDKLDWPDKAKVQLPDLVQDGVDILEKFRGPIAKKAEEYLATWHSEERKSYEYQMFRSKCPHDCLLGKLPAALLEHFQSVQVQLSKWKAWGGSMAMFAFDPDVFRNLIRKEMSTSAAAKSLLKEIDE